MQMPTISLYTICMFYEDAKHQSVLKYILKLHTKSEFTQVKLHSQKKKNKNKKKNWNQREKNFHSVSFATNYINSTILIMKYQSQ